MRDYTVSALFDVGDICEACGTCLSNLPRGGERKTGNREREAHTARRLATRGYSDSGLEFTLSAVEELEMT